MARHPATEGNDLQPNRVDAKRDVTVQGASVADAAQAVFVQDDEPEAPIPDGSRWTDTSLTPPATFIYDASTSVWIPINAGDRTFVSETEPDSEELLKGDIWFNTDPDDNDLAQEIYYFDGDVLVWLGDLTAIPDSADHHWPYSEGEDTTVSDDVGDEPLTFGGSPSWVSNSESFDGYHVNLDGSNDYLSAENQDNRFTALDDFSVFMVVKVDNMTEVPILIGSWVTDGDNRSWAIRIEDGEWNPHTSTDGSNFEISTIGSVQSDQGDWFSIAVTRDASTGEIEIYENKEPVASGELDTGTLYANDEVLAVGQRGEDAWWMEGSVDHYAFAIDHIWTQEEIDQLHDMHPRFK